MQMENVIDEAEPAQATEFKKWPVYKRRINVYETDMDGVVHFSNYFRIGEEAMWEGFRAIGSPFENSGYSVAMINADTTYINPFTFGHTVHVELAEVKAARVKFMLFFDFKVDGVVCARVKFTLVAIRPDERQSVPLDPDTKSVLTNCL